MIDIAVRLMLIVTIFASSYLLIDQRNQTRQARTDCAAYGGTWNPSTHMCLRTYVVPPLDTADDAYWIVV